MNAFDFTIEVQDGSKVELSKFKGKVLVIVNTATGCGFTPQYSKVDVNGDNAIPFYKWITENTKFEGFSGPMSVILKPIVKRWTKTIRTTERSSGTSQRSSSTGKEKSLQSSSLQQASGKLPKR